MTVSAPESARPASAAPSQLSLSSGHLPRWSPWALLALSFLIGFTPFALEAVASGSDLNIAGSVVLAGEAIALSEEEDWKSGWRA